jgi:hypothetical protein
MTVQPRTPPGTFTGTQRQIITAEIGELKDLLAEWAKARHLSPSAALRVILAETLLDRSTDNGK